MDLNKMRTNCLICLNTLIVVSVCFQAANCANTTTSNDDDTQVIKTNTTTTRAEASYPTDVLISIYLVGIMYCFVGISLVTQNYINPSIDIIKKKNVLSSDSMNATLLAMTNSAAESFIIMNSIFFGVSDIGISTICQQAAFYSFIIQGAFYTLAVIYNYQRYYIHYCVLSCYHN